MKKMNWKKIMGIMVATLGTTFVITSVIAKKKKGNSQYEDDMDQLNPLEGKKVVFIENDEEIENADGVRGHLEAIGNSDYRPGFYEKYVKRGFDIALSFGGLVVLSPLLAAITLAIRIDDPGPVLFTQKRMGQNKKYFKLHKFRSMKMCTPHDVPTHQLENPEQYITRVGKFLRSHSLDELPQIWDIFIGNMSVIGPRPGLWNQDVLTAERDKYNANDVKPGLTGWAQINGRDELEIPVKAKLDGEYVEHMGPLMDLKCFLGSVGVFAGDKSVVEGGTGEMKRKTGRSYTDGKSDKELIGNIGFGEPVNVDLSARKKVLITGAGSYIGESFKAYATEKYGDNFVIEDVDMLDGTWKDMDFSKYDIVYHVAGIAHADVGNVDEVIKEKYYVVNTDLAIEVCKKAKAEGVKEFIFMSSMIVYGASAPYGKSKIIDKNTVPNPANFYGDSKLQADVAVRELSDDVFKVIVLRPPMIYGKASRGNYPILVKLAKKLPVFPDVDNQRSMLYIENLCEFLCQIMLVDVKQNSTVLMPQNAEWTKTSEMVEEIAKVSGKKIKLIGGIMKLEVLFGGKMPGKIGGLVNKAFGNSIYTHKLSIYEGVKYQNNSLKESIKKTEDYALIEEMTGIDKNKGDNKVLMLASVASMIDQFNMSNIESLIELGYKVDVACNFEKGNTCSEQKIIDLKKRLSELGVNYYQIYFTRNVVNILKDIQAHNQVKKIVKKNSYRFIHCHSPIGGVVGRMVAHETKTKVIYTAHGFHFYNGASRKNWMIYYPIEKFLSKWTDILITINKEDYERAKKKFYAKETVYIPGIGIDIDRFKTVITDTRKKRTELGLEENDVMLLSVGELSERKNHEVVIRALNKIGNKRIKYFIVGKGELSTYLSDLISRLGMRKQVQLLGFRTDISELCHAADLFVFPSHQEGLPVAMMEAIASKTLIVASRIRGNVDLLKNDDYLFDQCDIEDVKSKINYALNVISANEDSSQIERNYATLSSFDLNIVKSKNEQMYKKMRRI